MPPARLLITPVRTASARSPAPEEAPPELTQGRRQGDKAPHQGQFDDVGGDTLAPVTQQAFRLVSQ
jgi:hypothetical protein